MDTLTTPSQATHVYNTEKDHYLASSDASRSDP